MRILRIALTPDWSEREVLYTSRKRAVCLLESIISRAHHSALGIKSTSEKKVRQQMSHFFSEALRNERECAKFQA